MKVHLRILLGPDRRYTLINNTVRVCKDYFDTIGVLNTGPQLFYDEVKRILPDYVNVRHHQDFFDIECARRHLISDVPQDQWVLWLDGDETPCLDFLKNIQRIIVECEFNGKNHVILPWYLHMDGKVEHEYNFFFETLASRDLYEHETTQKHYFAPKRFIKNIKEKSVRSNWGAHELFQMYDNKWTYYGYIVNHYKSKHDWAQSPVWHLFMNPLVHNAITEDQIKSVMELEIYKKVLEVKVKHNVYTSTDFIERVVKNDELFIKDFREIFESINDDNFNLHDQVDHKNIYRMYQFVKSFIEKYNFDFRLNPSYYCGKNCCNYDNHQL